MTRLTKKQLRAIHAKGNNFNNDHLRAVRVIYSNGDIIETDMAAGLSDKEITDYFKVGRIFNVGSGDKDKVARVKKVEILR